jgi:hypothetical protein
MHVKGPGGVLPTRTSISAVFTAHPVTSVAQAFDLVLRCETSVQLSVDSQTGSTIRVPLDLLPTKLVLALAACHTGTD